MFLHRIGLESSSSTGSVGPPLVSPKFPHVPVVVGGWPLGYEKQSKGVGLIVRAISFQDFQPM